jgi:hypothetical protein
MSEYLNEEHFKQILEDAWGQVFSKEGKGFKRHGLGIPLDLQPAFLIARTVGPEFLIGQAVKKMLELRIKEGPSWRVEALGAVVYCIFTIMWNDVCHGEKNEQER